VNREEWRQRVVGKPTIVELDVDGEKYHLRLPTGDVWQDMLDKIAAAEKLKDEGGNNRRWYEVITWSLANLLCDPDSKEMLFDAKKPEEIDLLMRAEGDRVLRLWKAAMAAFKEHVTVLGKQSGPTGPSSSG
jgi:hypothetical protein